MLQDRACTLLAQTLRDNKLFDGYRISKATVSRAMKRILNQYKDRQAIEQGGTGHSIQERPYDRYAEALVGVQSDKSKLVRIPKPFVQAALLIRCSHRHR